MPSTTKLLVALQWSLPARGARIEISFTLTGAWWSRSLPARGARIEIRAKHLRAKAYVWSLPARGARIEIRTRRKCRLVLSCRSPQGERGLKFHPSRFGDCSIGRSPQGERGLKLPLDLFERGKRRRSPQGERGLKYVVAVAYLHQLVGRSPQGERGLKFVETLIGHDGGRRSPQGERGLKSMDDEERVIRMLVAPRKGSAD